MYMACLFKQDTPPSPIKVKVELFGTLNHDFGISVSADSLDPVFRTSS